MFGSGVLSYFVLLRWLFLLNIVILLLTIFFLFIPQAIHDISVKNNNASFTGWELLTGEVWILIIIVNNYVLFSPFHRKRWCIFLLMIKFLKLLVIQLDICNWFEIIQLCKFTPLSNNKSPLFSWKQALQPLAFIVQCMVSFFPQKTCSKNSFNINLV